MLIKLYYIFLLVVLVSCTNNHVNVENQKAGELKATFQLVENAEKKFHLDFETAPRPPYIQMIKDFSERKIITFLNPYKNAIYFYDYEDTTFLKKIIYEKEGANAVLRLAGYYIKNMDSIYIYNMPMTEIILTNELGHLKNRISLRGGNEPSWPDYYPQYLFSTVNPLILKNHSLILTGQLFSSIPASNIDKFKYTACIDIQSNQVDYYHTYPKEIYGSNSNWEGGLPTQVYPTISHDGKLVHSYPASHDLYVTTEKSNTSTRIYGGSNIANTIHSLDYEEAKKTPDELSILHYLHEDMYSAIIYDPYRKMYYRFLLCGMPNASIKTSIDEKNINIILMDEEFNYLGETTIGTGKEWKWSNSFVTREGLNIEYIDNKDINEDYLILKTFLPKSL